MIIKNQVSKDILRILILTLITIFAWVAFDVYRVLSKDIQSEVLKEQTEPLNPELDLKIIEELNSRESPNEQDFARIPKDRPLQFNQPAQEKIASQSGAIQE